MDEPLDPQRVIDRTEQHTPVADAQAQPRRSTDQRDDVDVLAADGQGAQPSDDPVTLRPRPDATQVSLGARTKPDLARRYARDSSVANSPRMSSRLRPNSPRAISSSASRMPATNSGALART